VPDPVKPFAAAAIEHHTVVNADSLAAMAKAFGRFLDTDTATCPAADRYGLDLRATTRRGIAYTRVGFVEPDRFDHRTVLCHSDIGATIAGIMKIHHGAVAKPGRSLRYAQADKAVQSATR
jgi:hypothetical protein